MRRLRQLAVLITLCALVGCLPKRIVKQDSGSTVIADGMADAEDSLSTADRVADTTEVPDSMSEDLDAAKDGSGPVSDAQKPEDAAADFLDVDDQLDRLEASQPDTLVHTDAQADLDSELDSIEDDLLDSVDADQHLLDTVVGPKVTLLEQTMPSPYVTDIHFSPNGLRLCYLKRVSVVELWCYDLTQKTFSKVSEGLTVLDFKFASNDLVVFRGCAPSLCSHLLYSVTVTGDSLTPLSAVEMPLHANVRYRVASGKTVIFTGKQSGQKNIQLFAVGVNGGQVATLSHPGSDEALNVKLFQITPDMTQVVFVGDTETDDSYHIYRVLVTGGPITSLGNCPGSCPTAGNVFSTPHDYDDFQPGGQLLAIPPDSSKLYYLESSIAGDRLSWLPINGQANPTLISNTIDEGAGRNALQFRITSDGGTAVFSGYIGSYYPQFSISEPGLFRVNVSQEPLKVEKIASFSTTRMETGEFFSITSDDKFVLLDREMADSPTMRRLYSIRLSDSKLFPLSHQSTSTIGVKKYMASNDNSKVYFLSDGEEDGVFRLYSVAVTGGVIESISQNTTVGSKGDVVDFSLSGDGKRMLFWGNPEETSFNRLYSRDLDSGKSIPLSGPSNGEADSGVNGIVVSRDGAHVAFLGDSDQNLTKAALYIVSF